MTEDLSTTQSYIADELLELVPSLLQRLRTDIPAEPEDVANTPEWQDIVKLRSTTGQIRLLRILLSHQRCTMQELAEHLNVAPPTVTAMVKRLLEQELIERLRDENDWRVVWITLAEWGRRAITIYDNLRRTSLQRRLQCLSTEEQDILRTALPVLRHLIEVEP
jgi:DNA-binding MarR family transcriptional regulator